MYMYVYVYIYIGLSWFICKGLYHRKKEFGINRNNRGKRSATASAFGVRGSCRRFRASAPDESWHRVKGQKKCSTFEGKHQLKYVPKFKSLEQIWCVSKINCI